MKSARFRLFMVIVAAIALAPSPVRAVTFDNRPKILLHVKGLTTKNACTAGGTGILDCSNPAQITTNGVLTPIGGPGYYFVYLLAAKGPLLNVAGLQCGITYQNGQPGGASDLVGVDVFGWTLCAALEFISPGPNMWPQPGGGNLITWDSTNNCQTGEVGVAGYFYVGAYSTDELAVIPRPVDNQAKIGNCNNSETNLTPADLGTASFSAGAVVPGCNPCIQACSSIPGTLNCGASGFPTAGMAPLTVGFTGSASGGTPPYSYAWLFGDGGTSTLRSPPHTYTTAGVYTTSLEVRDSGSPQLVCTSVGPVITVTNLGCSAGAAPTSGSPPLIVSFAGSGAGGTPPYTYFWDFADGFTSTLQNPTHTYNSGGTFFPYLQVRDSSSPQQLCLSYTSPITVTPLMDCSATASPTTGEAPFYVYFNRSVSGGTSPYSYLWDFGDGTTSTTTSCCPSHRYTQVGTYTMNLTITDSSSPPKTCSITPITITATLSQYQMLVRSPNGGETWVAGMPHEVRWHGRYTTNLDISLDGGISWSPLAVGVGGQVENSLTVTAPSVESNSALIRAYYSSSNNDASDAPFRIVRPDTPPAAAHRPAGCRTGEMEFDALGTSVSPAGDLNGDGFADFAAGAPYQSAGGMDAGRVYVFLGGPAADMTPDLILTGAAGDLFGMAVAPAGDVNGDGDDDLIVGAPMRGAGHAYVFFGGPGLDGTPDLTLAGVAVGDAFGSSVAGRNDLNGDGHSDLLVGAPAAGSGAAYFYFGGPGLDATADLTLTGEAAQDQFGAAVTSAGDMNGDGYGDFGVGAPLNDGGGFAAGRAYVYFGGGVPDGAADLTVSGSFADAEVGRSMGLAGDINGDGTSDLMVGAPAKNTGGAEPGRVFVIYGSLTPDGIPDLTLTGTAPVDLFGWTVGGGGDLNGDGYDDMVVGAPGSDAGGPEGGRAYVFFGNNAPDDLYDAVFPGQTGYDRSGWSVAVAGDVRSDGFADLLFGAPGFDMGGDDVGQACLFDFNRYLVLSPAGGAIWNVGGTEIVEWLGSELAALWLSVDGGRTYDPLRTNVGGHDRNILALLVPHAPTRFARIKVTPMMAVRGEGVSDSLFTIQTDVQLLAFRAEPQPQGGTLLSWSTEPGVSREGLKGYRLYRLAPGDNGLGERIGPDLILDERYVDNESRPGSSYRLTAVNGFMEELEIGRLSLSAPFVGLRIAPSPARVGTLIRITLSAPGAAPDLLERALDVGVFDLSGRRLATPQIEGSPGNGLVTLTWDGTGASGPVGSGVYFIRAHGASGLISIEARERLVLLR